MGDNLPFVNFGADGGKVVSVQTGWLHTCVLFDDQKLKCFGANQNGQLGLGDNIDRYEYTYLQGNEYVDLGAEIVRSMHLGKFHTCVMLESDQVKCFGLNRNGQLGLGDRRSRGRFPTEMGNNLQEVKFGTGRYAIRLFSSGGNTVCALLNTAELKCWGGNEGYALGMGIAQDENIGDQPNEMGDALVAIELPTGKTVVNIWVSTHIFVLFDDHTMTQWGKFITEYKETETTTVGSLIEHMGDALRIINPGAGRKPVQAMLNRFSTTVLFDNGDVVGFGMNQDMSLGRCTGSIIDPYYYVDIPSDIFGIPVTTENTPLLYFGGRLHGMKVKGLASNSFSHFCVITQENEVVCWGLNDHGQLGLGHAQQLM
jgi:hypothetical protein